MTIGSNSIWRYVSLDSEYSTCAGFELPSGYLIINRPFQRVELITTAYYVPYCYKGSPALSSFKRHGTPLLPLIMADWDKFVATSSGSFRYSIYPIIYVLTVSTVITVFLTIIVFTNYTRSPSWLLRLGSILGSVNLGIAVVRFIIYLSQQHSLGILSSEKFMDRIESDLTFNIIDFIFVLVTQFAQVQIIIRLFSRVKEKRVSLILGGTVSICAQIIWGVSTFANYDVTIDSDITILPAFTYLLRIALSTMYSGLVIIYGVSKINFIFHRSIFVLTILTFLVINFQVAFFITDVSNIWVSELSEVFNTTIYVMVTVIPWEWINRVHVLERNEQREGVLGRQVFEDEYKQIPRYEVIDYIKKPQTWKEQTNEEDKYDDNEDLTTSVDKTKGSSVCDEQSDSTSINFKKKMKDTFNNTTNALLYFTDQVIAYGLAVPRSVSASTASPTDNASQRRVRSNTRKDIFVYSKKEVICQSEEEEEDVSFTSYQDI